MNENYHQKINCNVETCAYHKQGDTCEKNSIYVCCSEKGCTCCGNYTQK